MRRAINGNGLKMHIICSAIVNSGEKNGSSISSEMIIQFFVCLRPNKYIIKEEMVT